MTLSSVKTTFFSVFTICLLLTGGLVLAQSFPQPDNFVTDQANILSEQTEAELESTLAQFEASTSTEIAVVTVESLEGLAIEQYSIELATKWGIGKSSQDNGVLLLIAPNDRDVRIEVGYGLEGALPDATAYGIIQKEIIPEFKNNNYENGIINGVNSIIRATQDEVYSEEIGKTSLLDLGSDALGGILIFGFAFFHFFILLLIRVLGRTKSWWLGGVLGAIAGIIIYVFFNSLWIFIILLTLLGLLIDFILSRSYKKHGKEAWWYYLGGRGSGGSGGGGFSFGGGSFGGGGASGSW